MILINWILQSLLAKLLEIVSGVLDYISEQFNNLMGLSGATTLDFFFKIFMPNFKNSTISETSIWGIILACGFLVLYGIFLFQLFKAFFGPLAKAESPVKLLVKTLFFGILVASSSIICKFIFELGTAPYQLLSAADYGAPGEKVKLGEMLVGGFREAFEGEKAGDYLETILSLTIVFSVLVNYMKLIIEVAERYVIMGVLSIFSPLCIATGASESTSNIFSSWIKMMLSQCVLMCMSVFFLKVFQVGISNISSAQMLAEEHYTPFIGLVLLLAWLRTGQRIDSHMSTLGLTAAQAGNGLYADLFAGNALRKSVMNGAGSAISTGIGSAKAGSLPAYLASNEFARQHPNISNVARALSNNQDKIRTSAFNARETGMDRGQSAKAGFAAKYGESIPEGHKLLSAVMTPAGGKATVVDENGNQYDLIASEDGKGGYKTSIDVDSQESAASAKGASEINTENMSDVQTALGTEGQEAPNIETAFGENMEPVIGQAENAFMADDNNAIVDTGDGIELKDVAEGEDGNQHVFDSTETDEHGMITANDGYQMAGQDLDERMEEQERAMYNGQDVTDMLDENGKVKGDLVDENGMAKLPDGTEVAAADIESGASMESRFMAMGEDGNMHDITDAVQQSQEINSDAIQDGVATASDGTQMSAEALQQQAVAEDRKMIDTDSGKFDVTAAFGEDGKVDASKLDKDGNFDLGNGQVIAGSAIAANATTESRMMANGHDFTDSFTTKNSINPSAVNNEGKITSSDGYSMSTSKTAPVTSAMGLDNKYHAMTNSLDKDGNLDPNKSMGPVVYSNHAVQQAGLQAAKPMAQCKDGNLHSFASSVDSNGRWKQSAIDSNNMVTSDDGKYQVKASEVTPVMGAIGTDNKAHDVSPYVDFSGNVRNGTNTSAGHIKTADGSTVATSYTVARDENGNRVNVGNRVNFDGTTQKGVGSSFTTTGGAQVNLNDRYNTSSSYGYASCSCAREEISAAMTPTFSRSENNSGSYVKTADGNHFKEFVPTESGGVTYCNERGVPTENNAVSTYALCKTPDGGTAPVRISEKTENPSAAKTYDRSMSYNGIQVSNYHENADGSASFSIPINKGASIKTVDGGEHLVDLGNGVKLKAYDAQVFDAQPGMASMTIGGRKCWVDAQANVSESMRSHYGSDFISGAACQKFMNNFDGATQQNYRRVNPRAGKDGSLQTHSIVSGIRFDGDRVVIQTTQPAIGDNGKTVMNNGEQMYKSTTLFPSDTYAPIPGASKVTLNGKVYQAVNSMSTSNGKNVKLFGKNKLSKYNNTLGKRCHLQSNIFISKSKGRSGSVSKEIEKDQRRRDNNM